MPDQKVEKIEETTRHSFHFTKSSLTFYPKVSTRKRWKHDDKNRDYLKRDRQSGQIEIAPKGNIKTHWSFLSISEYRTCSASSQKLFQF